jgi:hypothetical protein
MSCEVRTFARIHCDAGCGSFYDGHRAPDARDGALKDGWSFPSKLRTNGEKSKQTSDVCPSCSADFDPVPTHQSKKWSVMSKDERRLRVFYNYHWNMISPEERERVKLRLSDFEKARTSL